MRTIRSIGPDAFAPGTWLQLRTRPEKMSCTCSCERSPMRIVGVVAMQTPSRAMRLKTRPPGSEGSGSREELPIVTRPCETSAMPMSDPPWLSRNLTLPLPACLQERLRELRGERRDRRRAAHGDGRLRLRGRRDGEQRQDECECQDGSAHGSSCLRGRFLVKRPPKRRHDVRSLPMQGHSRPPSAAGSERDVFGGEKVVSPVADRRHRAAGRVHQKFSAFSHARRRLPATVLVDAEVAGASVLVAVARAMRASAAHAVISPATDDRRSERRRRRARRCRDGRGRHRRPRLHQAGERPAQAHICGAVRERSLAGAARIDVGQAFDSSWPRDRRRRRRAARRHVGPGVRLRHRPAVLGLARPRREQVPGAGPDRPERRRGAGDVPVARDERGRQRLPRLPGAVRRRDAGPERPARLLRRRGARRALQRLALVGSSASRRTATRTRRSRRRRPATRRRSAST